MADVKDVAAAIMESVGDCTTMKLQKLLYYCQGWHLAWDGVPLFKAEIEAWSNGPVVREIYNLHRGQFRLAHPWPKKGNANKLSHDEQETVTCVLDTYGSWTADQLSNKTHRELPWLIARDGLAATDQSTQRIDLDVMQNYFCGLLEEQRD